MKRRRTPGMRWRFLAHEAPSKRTNGMYGRKVEYDSETHGVRPSVFDEIVVDRWLHVEQQDTVRWWANIGGVTIWITVNADGTPRHVAVYGPGDYADPEPGCTYKLDWNDEKENS